MTEQAALNERGHMDDDISQESQSASPRFTTRYDPIEDRVKLSIALKDGETKLLWLTRRLMVLVVPQLVKIVDRNGRRRAARQAAPTSVENFHRKTQMAALGALTPQKPVVPDNPDDSILVSGLTFKQTPQGLHLVFLGKDKAPCASVPFNEPLLRQWLVVLQQNFSAAGWQEDIWPDWMTLKGGGDAPGALRLN